MSTSQTAEKFLRKQANVISSSLKAMEDKEGQGSIPRDAITFGIVMDDKVIKMTMTWDKIRKTSKEALTVFIVKHMQGQSNDS
jgi:hypothetical protein